MEIAGRHTSIPRISEDQGREHARAMYELLGHEEWGVTELRALGNNGPWVAYVDNAASFVERAMERNRVRDHVYVGVQPRPIDRFELASDEWRPACGGSNGNVARADDIEYVTAVALDIDVATPERRSGQPASNEELTACIEAAERVSKLDGFVGTAAVALSRNGLYVINPIVPIEVDGDIASKLKVLEGEWIEHISHSPEVRIDPIADLVRIIRVIGTVNYKGTAVEGRPHRRSCFLMSPLVGGRQRLLAERLQYLSVAPARRASGSSGDGSPAVRGDLKQFQACEFVKWVARDAASIPEPVWMDFLVQAAWLKGGDHIAHEISRRDPARYSQEKTQARLDRIRRMGYRPKQCHRLSGRDGYFQCPRLRTCPASRPIELAAQPYSKEKYPMD